MAGRSDVVIRPDVAACAVRPATAADLPSIGLVGHAAIDAGDFPDATHHDMERTLASLAAEPESAYVAIEDGQVVGYLAPRLNDLCVDAAHRRRGHASALVEAALPYVRDVLGHPYLLLYVPPGDVPGASLRRGPRVRLPGQPLLDGAPRRGRLPGTGASRPASSPGPGTRSATRSRPSSSCSTPPSPTTRRPCRGRSP